MLSMDDIIKALLNGATDQTILDMLEEFEFEHKKNEEASDDARRPEYESCIKVNGQSLLPPVMTDQKRLDSLMWKRKALDVEAKIAAKRRERLARNIEDIVANVENKREHEPETDTSLDYSEDDYKDEQEESLCVYEIMRCNSRAADELIHSIDTSVIMSTQPSSTIHCNTPISE